MQNKQRECRKNGCSEPMYLGGLCSFHSQEKEKNDRRNASAIETLHTALIGGRSPDNLELKTELFRLRKWWDRACRSVNHKIQDDVLRDEAEYALDWCIAIAQEIIDEELAYRDGRTEKNLSKENRKGIWERFENLEAGLMSNGVPRPNE